MTLHLHPNEFAQRRAKLMQTIGKGNIGIIAAAPEYLRNGDTHYPYRQDSNFYYLTGFPEPEAMAVFAPGRPEGEYILFCRAKDPVKEIWDGPRVGPEKARVEYGAQQVFPIQEFETRKAELIANRNVVDLKPHVAEMRLHKSDGEIRLMRKAAEVSMQGHTRAMQCCRPGLTEAYLEAELLHEFTQHGCRAVAYPSIVAGGINSCTLHYTDNNAELRKGDLVLIDAGCEYQYYASDITRTFPINGKFSTAQREIYEIVLAAQLAAIEQIRPGLPFSETQQTVVKILTQGLTDLDILKNNVDLKNFYMHGAGHWLGMDVHDAGAYKINDVWRPLEPGMVITVEPGIYIAPNSKDVDPKWWGIGIRIEDDVLVTANGHEVLTAALPKTVSDIEALMAK